MGWALVFPIGEQQTKEQILAVIRNHNTETDLSLVGEKLEGVCVHTAVCEPYKRGYLKGATAVLGCHNAGGRQRTFEYLLKNNVVAEPFEKPEVFRRFQKRFGVGAATEELVFDEGAQQWAKLKPLADEEPPAKKRRIDYTELRAEIESHSFMTARLPSQSATQWAKVLSVYPRVIDLPQTIV